MKKKIILFLILLILAKILFKRKILEHIKSDVDGRIYEVQDLPDKKYAADLLAIMRKKILLIIDHLKKPEFKDNEIVQKLFDRCNPDKIREGDYDPQYTSYTVNKGEEIVFCLRSRKINKFNKLHDINLMTFVCLHELSHICNDGIGHDQGFHDNFNFLLDEAKKINLYNPDMMNSSSVEYCGLTISMY